MTEVAVRLPCMRGRFFGWLWKLLQSSLVVVWLALTRWTVSNHSVYCLLGFAALAALADNAFAELEADVPDKRNGSKRQVALMLSWAIFVGAAVTLAEYGLFESCPSKIEQLVRMVVLFVGVTVSAWHVAKCLFARLRTFFWTPGEWRFSVRQVFCMTFVFLVTVYTVYLFSAHYPGSLTCDSCDQLEQVFGMKPFNNHHPVLHTLTMGFLVWIGRFLFGGVEAGIAFFCVCQIVFLAISYSYMLSSLYRAGVSFLAIVIATLWLAFLPNHLFYSSVLWKNPVFAGFAVLYLTSLFWMISGWRGRRESILLVVTAVGFCLYLTNGLAAYLISLPIMVLALRRLGLRIRLALIVVAVVSLVFKFPVLKILDVRQHGPFEALTIPVQQIARVLHDGKEVSQEDLALIGRLAPVEAIAEAYSPGYNDPVKWMITPKGDREFVPCRGKYLSMWIRLGLRYPGKFLKAWIDQTRGYWNGGYNQWPFLVIQNESGFPGVRGTSSDNRILMGLIEYEQAFREWPVLQPFLAIGLHVWIVSLLLLFSIAFHRCVWILYVPIFSVYLTLCMAAPIFHDFRYAYPLFTCLPLFIFAPFCRRGALRAN